MVPVQVVKIMKYTTVIYLARNYCPVVLAGAVRMSDDKAVVAAKTRL